MHKTSLLISSCLLCHAVPAFAQQTVTLSAEQIELNNMASTALNQEPPDSKAAIGHLTEALKSGPAADILYMSLGRAYQYEDQCQSAEETFALADAAGSLEGLPHDVIMKKIARYREESEKLCSGSIEFACEDATVQFVNASGRYVCGEKATFRPGAQEFEVRRGREILGNVTGLVLGMQERPLDPGELIAKEKLEDKKDPVVVVQTPAQDDGVNGYRVVRYVSVGALATGLSLLGVGIYFNNEYNKVVENRNNPVPKSRQDELLDNRNDSLIAGGVLAGVGVIGITSSLILESRKKKRAAQSTITPGVMVHDGGASIRLHMEF